MPAGNPGAGFLVFFRRLSQAALQHLLFFWRLSQAPYSLYPWRNTRDLTRETVNAQR